MSKGKFKHQNSNPKFQIISNDQYHKIKTECDIRQSNDSYRSMEFQICLIFCACLLSFAMKFTKMLVRTIYYLDFARVGGFYRQCV